MSDYIHIAPVGRKVLAISDDDIGLKVLDETLMDGSSEPLVEYAMKNPKKWHPRNADRLAIVLSLYMGLVPILMKHGAS